MSYILGVDAGATKTHAAIAGSDGKIVGRASAGPANFHASSVNEFRSSIQEAIQGAALEVNIEPPVFEAACLGIAGIDTDPQIQDAKELLLDVVRVKSPDKLLVVNDLRLVRPTVSDKEYGLSLIAGTGSNFYGVNKKGEEASVGGLGHILSDEGSGYWIGIRVLRAAVRSADGRGPKTALEGLVGAHFKTKTMREVADVVYRESFSKADIGTAAIVVDEAYRQKDEVATVILENAATEIALSLNTLTRRLGMEEDSFDVIAVGGVFLSPYPFKEKIKEQLINKNIEFIVSDKAPVEGALALALKLV